MSDATTATETVQLARLCAIARPQPQGLVCNADDALLECGRDWATFRGIVGEGNRSVQALTAFPPVSGRPSVSSLLGALTDLKKWTLCLVDRFVSAAAEEPGAKWALAARAAYRGVGSAGSSSGGSSPRHPRRRKRSSSSSSSSIISPTTHATSATVFACPAVVRSVVDAAVAEMEMEWSDTAPSTFSTPFMLPPAVDGGGGGFRAFVGSRFIAYYEVRIAPTEAYVAPPPLPPPPPIVVDGGGGGGGDDDAVPTDCVAVGLATQAFLRHRRMPGWDAESYGYHGDDGAIFHGRGRQLSKYGPSFGPGDVVGCGIDYSDSTVFFTLNGVCLGTAFTLFPRADATELYPTVGVDAAVSVTLNYGREPFVFDLLQHMSKREAQLGFDDVAV